MEGMTFVLFGATGDLAKRKIFPALYNLYLDQKMPQSISIIGLGRHEMSDKEFQNNVEQSLKTFSRRVDNDRDKMDRFLAVFRYSVLEGKKANDFEKLLTLVKKLESKLNFPDNQIFSQFVGPEFFGPMAL